MTKKGRKGKEKEEDERSSDSSSNAKHAPLRARQALTAADAAAVTAAGQEQRVRSLTPRVTPALHFFCPETCATAVFPPRTAAGELFLRPQCRFLTQGLPVSFSKKNVERPLTQTRKSGAEFRRVLIVRFDWLTAVTHSIVCVRQASLLSIMQW